MFIIEINYLNAMAHSNCIFIHHIYIIRTYFYAKLLFFANSYGNFFNGNNHCQYNKNIDEY